MMKRMRMSVVLTAAVCLVGNLLIAGPALAEQLRFLTVQGTMPADHVDAFTQMIREKYQVELEVSVEYWAEPGEIYQALRNKTADVISCPHNVPKDLDFKLIDGKFVLPVNLDNIPNYADIIPALQQAGYISDQGAVYGVPYAHAPYGLAYNTAEFPVPPTSWDVLWQPEYAGQYVLSSAFYELNVMITALALDFDTAQLADFRAVSSPEFQEKLQYLAHNAGAMWTLADTADDLQGKALAAAWGYAFRELQQRGEVWRFARPTEGTLNGVGNFMISHTLRDDPAMKRIAEEWLNYSISPAYQMEVIMGAYFPVNLRIRNQLAPELVEYYHLDTPEYFKEQMILWPVLDKRTRTAFELFWNKATR